MRRTAACLALALSACVTTQEPVRETGQRGDASFEFPDTGEPAFAPGTGPRVGIDGAHHNYHTATGRYRAFAEILRRDGYRVDAFDNELSPEALRDTDILVISNAVAEENEGNWSRPNHGAFAAAEVEVVRDWVAGGGRLMLIADHMPFPGAAADLALAFGVLFHDGYAFRADGGGQMTFRREDGGPADGDLAEHAVTRDVPFVTTFTGQAFRLGAGVDGDALMTLAADAYLLLPFRAGQFPEGTARIPATGMHQGVLVRHGDGRVAVFGEAAQFSAQVSGAGARPMGMNHPNAPHNARFLLNVMGWLSAGS